jgi:hypothetical protein
MCEKGPREAEGGLQSKCEHRPAERLLDQDFRRGELTSRENFKQPFKFLGIGLEAWSLIANLVTIVSLLLALAAGLLAWLEYRDRREEALATRTLEFISTWDERGYRRPYSLLRDQRKIFFDSLSQADRLAAHNDARARSNVYFHFYSAFFKNEQNEEAFNQVKFFFNMLSLCLEANLCSKNISKTFFDDTIKTFLDCFGVYLEEEALVTGAASSVVQLRYLLSLESGACFYDSAPQNSGSPPSPKS